MLDLNKCNRFLDEGFSIITVSENKVPNYSWKEQQTTPLSKNELEIRYNYQGGGNRPKTDNIGIVTGYDDLECIDVDLKVFSTAKERIDFWDELISFLRDNIYDFDDKFVIYKTKNAGYHILYKSKRVEGNKKISALKGHKEQVIESRGIGGYIFVYDEKNVSDKTYFDIDYISDEDREILWAICKSYNYVEDKIIETPEPKEYDASKKSPWEDYNQKTSSLDLLSGQFKIVRSLKDKYIIKRFGSKSSHSGYVFKDSGCMWLYSTGTSFDTEKLYSPFLIYAHLNHNDNLKAAASELYSQGFGDRFKPKPIIKNEEIVKIDKDDLIFPIEIFPDVLQKYISVCNKTLNNSIDYMGCSMLFLGSIIIGNSFVINVKNGWNESANLWLSLVGKAGIGKTPSIGSVLFPIEKINNKEIKAYIKHYEKYEAYNDLDTKEKKLTEEIFKPKKTQFIVNDITLEALIDLHGENKNGIGVFKDELAGWFKDMNKYRQGSDLEHWLSSWSGKQINMNRKTAKSSFVQRAFIPVLGGIQPSIMDNFYTEENKDSGFIDRMLFAYPEVHVSRYNDDEMQQDYLNWYEDYIINLYQDVKKLIKLDSDFEIVPYVSKFSPDAKKEWIRIFNEITELQNSDMENEYMKSMLPKQKAYIPRFALIINTFMSNEDESITLDVISKEAVLRAEKLSKYFIAMAKKIKVESNIRKDVKKIVVKNESKNNYDKFKAVYSSNKSIKKSEIANILNVSRQTIYKYIKEFDSEQ